MVNTPLIFYSADYEKALAKAKAFAKELIGKGDGHPDFFEIQLEGKTYTKEQIVDFLSDVALSPYESKYKVTLFHRADKMLPVHANALLKTFEEKPEHAAILLVTDNVKGILETILSRSKKVYVAKEEEKNGSPVESVIKQALIQVAGNDIYGCLDTIAAIEEAHLDDVKDTLLLWYRDLQMLKLGIDNVNYLETKEVFPKLKRIPSLEVVHEWVKEATIAFERHTRMKLILEYLFLKAHNFFVTSN